MSSNSSSFTFPSPIGGVPFPSDYAPSVLFAVLYAVLIPIIIWRLVSPKSRTFLLIGTVAFIIERIVIFGLRSEEARNAEKRVSNNLTLYMQTTLSIGYISVAANLLPFLRCLLVSATLSSSGSSKAKYLSVDDAESNSFLDASYNKGTVPAFAATSASIVEERSVERARYRRICSILAIAHWTPFILGTVAGIVYIKAEKDVQKAQLEQQLRYGTGALSFLFVTSVQCLALYSAVAVRNIDRKPTWLLFGLASLLNVISVYRLVVMRLQTDSLTSMAPGSLNSTASKITFYALHIVPDWLAAAILVTIDVREIFETGLWGDQFKPKEKEKLKSEGSG